MKAVKSESSAKVTKDQPQVEIDMQAIENELRSPAGYKLAKSATELGVAVAVLRKCLEDHFGKDNLITKRGRSGGTFLKS